MTHDFTESAIKTVVGFGGFIWAKVAAITPFQEQGSWALGILVGVLSAISFSFDIRRKWRNRDK